MFSSLPSLILPHTFQYRERHAERVFYQAFQGVAHQNFISALDIYDKMYDPKIHFGRIIPLLQSSGTGKSRILDEIGKMVRFEFVPMFTILTVYSMARCPHSASASERTTSTETIGRPTIHRLVHSFSDNAPPISR
jgi:hypothetical protein